jgi:chlorobactene glucosyltransferase
MGLIALILLLFSIIRWGVSLYNRVTLVPWEIPKKTKVSQTSLLIPIRNEMENLSNLLKCIEQLDPPPMEVIFLDDHSQDTSATYLMEWSNRQKNCRIIRGAPLPKNYVGKPFACAQLAEQAKGKFLLFIDADVRISPQSIAILEYESEKKSYDLLSVFPFQLYLFFGEELVVPLIFQTLLSMLPLRWVERFKNPIFAAANGQVMMFQKSMIDQIDLFSQTSKMVLDDVAAARIVKKNQGKVGIRLGENHFKTLMYRGSKAAREGFSKNLVPLLGGNIGGVTFLFLQFIFPLLVLFSSYWWIVPIIIVVNFISWLINQTGHSSLVPFQLWVYYPFYQTQYLRTLLLSLWKTNRKTAEWKGRRITG